MCAVSWLHWENHCKRNVYYADQGLQITTVHFWHPSCTLSVWQLALRFDSAVRCSSQHGHAFLPCASTEPPFCRSCDRATVALSVSCCKSDCGDVATKYNGHCSCKATVYCPRSMLINICGHFVNCKEKK